METMDTQVTFFEQIGLYFEQGGLWMWVILALQVVAIAIAVERAIALYGKRKITEKAFAGEFEGDIRRGELGAVLKKAEAQKESHPLARVIQAGAQAALNLGGKEEIQGKMDEVLLEENSRNEKRTGFLSMLANAGTLTGLLGTIIGMIQSFSAISSASPVEKATLLSSGISQAMNTTAYGLIMAIPTVILFAILSNRANSLNEDLNQGALKVFNWLSYAYDPIPARAGKAARKQALVDIDGANA